MQEKGKLYKLFQLELFNMFAKAKRDFFVGTKKSAVKKGEIREIVSPIGFDARFCVAGKDGTGIFGGTDLKDWEIATTKEELEK